ncbi:SgcJ/EcaC family oxidoreductase [Streptomyces sp. RK62]|uniref:YybH family protein n=1 Tax=Streptomyces sp. RK62 TaxID=2824893 RepID=UPI001B39C54C|nr:SgcJ/EcaC family oxidoreductase [Streptomyces sp. RK62]MBQ0995208.1 SgcJ/EcaC family oxidoreductase [Streptomyces sp. RK62]
MPSITDDETVLHDVLERWRTAVDAHRPQDVAAVFTEDAIFQGLHPYGVGRDAVTAYYASQPLGMRAAYRILETRRFADDLVLGYLDVEFTFTDRDPVAVKLAVLARRQDDGWYLAHYQVSRLAQ